MAEDIPLDHTRRNVMSNSSRIENATRQHVGAVLTSQQVVELVKLSDPTNLKGCYPGDSAGKQLEDGSITFRGKMSYGDLVLLQVSSGQYKVLPTEQIVRRKNPTVVPVPVPVAAAPEPKKEEKKRKPGQNKRQAEVEARQQVSA
jgi:hypothetical protein